MPQEECVDTQRLKERIRNINAKLLRASYGDELFQNSNLSNQIQVRLPLLIADSVKLTAPGYDDLRDDFLQELTLLSDRFLRSRRFRAGIGLSYAYLPTLRYMDVERVDFSPYQSAPSGGADAVIFNTQFTDQSLPALILSAKVPYLQLDIEVPKLKHEQSIATPVQQRPGDGNNDLLARTTVNAKLSVEYEASAKLSFMDVWQAIQDRKCKDAPVDCKSNYYQYDFGLGIGMTGFRIKNDVSTDVRFRSDPTQVFNDLQPGATITSKSDSAFNTIFLTAFYTFRISDEFQLGIDARYYDKKKVGSREVDIEGLTAGFSAVWYPTYSWRAKAKKADTSSETDKPADANPITTSPEGMGSAPQAPKSGPGLRR
jgi:hypothetical protein